MEKEISRSNHFVVRMHVTQQEEYKFALVYLLNPKDKQGILAIQHLLTEEMLHEITSALSRAVDYIDSTYSSS